MVSSKVYSLIGMQLNTLKNKYNFFLHVFSFSISSALCCDWLDAIYFSTYGRRIAMHWLKYSVRFSWFLSLLLFRIRKLPYGLRWYTRHCWWCCGSYQYIPMATWGTFWSQVTGNILLLSKYWKVPSPKSRGCKGCPFIGFFFHSSHSCILTTDID